MWVKSMTEREVQTCLQLSSVESTVSELLMTCRVLLASPAATTRARARTLLCLLMPGFWAVSNCAHSEKLLAHRLQ